MKTSRIKINEAETRVKQLVARLNGTQAERESSHYRALLTELARAKAELESQRSIASGNQP